MGSAEGGRGANDRHTVALAPAVGVAGTSNPAPSVVVNVAVASQNAAWQAKLERAEEQADQLYRLAEAAQAAVEVLRPKLAQAEAKIDRLERSRTAVAIDLFRQTHAHEAMQVSMASSQMEIARLRLAVTQAQQEAAERGASLRATEGEVAELRALLDARDAAVTAADEQSRAIAVRLAEALGDIEETRAQLAVATKETAERGAAVETLKAELAALRGDLSATGQVARELMIASTGDPDSPQQPSQGGGARPTMLGFGRAMRARAIKGGDRARDAKRWQVAAQYYHRALACDPFDAPTLVQYGHALKEAGHLSEAEAAYRRSLACDAGVADTHLQLGYVLKLQGRATAAQASYLRAFALDPAMPFPAQELAGLGWSDTHISRLCELSKTPDILQLQSLRAAADAARDRRDWSSATRLYGELVAADPTALNIAVQLGHAHKEMGDLDRAAQVYYSVLEATPSDDDLHLQIGHLEKLRRNLAAAAAHYKKAVELNPDNVDALREFEALRDHSRQPILRGKAKPSLCTIASCMENS
jgi:tetratricopeptide (TPR) repeat protein